MSHPISGHDYSEETYPSDSPHKDIGGTKLNKTQKMTGKWLKEAGKHVRKGGENHGAYLKREVLNKHKK